MPADEEIDLLGDSRDYVEDVAAALLGTRVRVAEPALVRNDDDHISTARAKLSGVLVDHRRGVQELSHSREEWTLGFRA